MYSLEERVMLTVHEIIDKKLKRKMAGPTTKVGQGLKKSVRRKKLGMLKLLNELYLWKVIGTDQSVDQHRLPDAAVKEMLKTGEGPWQTGVGAAIYWGKLAHRCQSDIARCLEEMPVLGVEKLRLERWAARAVRAVDARVQVVGEGCGQGILLGRWKKLLVGLSDQLIALKW